MGWTKDAAVDPSVGQWARADISIQWSQEAAGGRESTIHLPKSFLLFRASDPGDRTQDAQEGGLRGDGQYKEDTLATLGILSYLDLVLLVDNRCWRNNEEIVLVLFFKVAKML